MNFKKLSIICLMFVLAFSLTGCLKSDQTAIKETINKYFQGLKDESKKDISAIIDPNFPFRSQFLANLDTLFYTVDFTSITVTINTITVVGDVASADTIVLWSYVDGEGQSGTEQFARTFKMAKHSGKWYIADFE